MKQYVSGERLIRLPLELRKFGVWKGVGENDFGVVFYDDVIYEMGSSISWKIKSRLVRTRHSSKVRQQPILHVKDAMDKCVYHIIVAACLLLGFAQSMSYVQFCTF